MGWPGLMYAAVDAGRPVLAADRARVVPVLLLPLPGLGVVVPRRENTCSRKGDMNDAATLAYQ